MGLAAPISPVLPRQGHDGRGITRPNHPIARIVPEADRRQSQAAWVRSSQADLTRSCLTGGTEAAAAPWLAPTDPTLLSWVIVNPDA